MQENSDQELVKKCIQKDRKAQETLYRKFADDMYSVAMIYANNSSADACDILQDAFIRVFKYLPKFKFQSELRSWIRRIVVNVAIDYYKKKQKEYELFAPLADNGIITKSIDNILSGLNFKDIIKLVNELPKKAQMVLKLYCVEGYKHREIAGILGINEGTSKSQLNRAKKLLSDSINQHYGK